MNQSYKLQANSYKLLKIGIVCHPSIGGSGIVATNLGLELAKFGHKVHFISYEPPFKLGLKTPGVFFHKVNINEYSLFKYPDYALPLAVTIEEVQKKYNLDVVHVHYAVPHATAALLAKRIMRQNNIQVPKIITTLHGTDITLLAKDPSLFAIIKYSIECSDGVTAVSQNLKNDTIKLLNTKKPIQAIHNFFTPPLPTKSRGIIRKGLKIKDNDFLAIHLSNLRPIKRIPDLLKIISLIKNPKFKLLILSGGDFSPYAALAKKLNVQNRIIVKHKVSGIGNYINAADLGIYTSQTESFGMGILECMSYGKPVLVTRSGGIPEVVNNEKDGYLFKVGDVKAFAKKIKLLIKNPELMQNLGKNAAKTAKEKFSANTIVKQYLKLYSGVRELK